MKRDRANYSLQRFKGKDGDWYWRQVDLRNGKIVGGSTEGYIDPDDCAHNCSVVTGWGTFDEDEV